MRLRYWTALLISSGVALAVLTQCDWHPQDRADLSEDVLERRLEGGGNSLENGEMSTSTSKLNADQTAEDDETVVWTRVVGAGDSLSGLLAKSDLGSEARSEVTKAIGSEFDLRHLKPGHSLSLSITPDGLPRTATLEIEDGTRIVATFGEGASIDRVAPDLDSVRRAGASTIKSSIYAALDNADIPTRFATDLELIFAGVLDLRSSLTGGEKIRLLWREHSFEGRVVGDPTIDFAQLDLADGSYEIVWPDDESRRTSIFKDDQLIETFDQPIKGARLSSAFGMRMHPIHQTMRMHSGLDFAATPGSGVVTTQAGKITFMGKRSGYGLLVEVEHKGGMSTLYAHLSAVNEALKVGERVPAGVEVGKVGSSGTSTAPHLHYEIRVDDRPVSPLADNKLRGLDITPPDEAEAKGLIKDMQSEVDRILGSSG